MFRPNLPRLMSLSLTFYFYISSCLERLSNQVICGHFWDYGRTTGIINQDCPRHTGSGWPLLWGTHPDPPRGFMWKVVLLAALMVQTLGTLSPFPFCSPPTAPLPSPHTPSTLFPFLSPLDHSGTFSSPSLGLLRVSFSRYFHLQFILNTLTTSVFVKRHFHQPTYTQELPSCLFTGLSPSSSAVCGSWSASCWPVQGSFPFQPSSQGPSQACCALLPSCLCSFTYDYNLPSLSFPFSMSNICHLVLGDLPCLLWPKFLTHHI